MKKKLKLKRGTEGQSLVEFALVLPILIFLILGMIEFGWILNGQIVLTSAAREGARVAVVCESAPLAQDPVQTAAQNAALGSSLIGVLATPDFEGDTATVIATAKIHPIIGLFFSSDVTLTAKAEMRIEKAE